MGVLGAPTIMSEWSLDTLIESTRYCRLGVLIGKDARGNSCLRRVRRQGSKLVAHNKDNFKLILPAEFSGVILRTGDLVCISEDYTCSVLRNERDESFSTLEGRRIILNENYFKDKIDGV